jgi:deoxyribonuclease V
MILATDVHYYSDYAIAAGVVFKNWQDATPIQTYTCRIEHIKPYISGQFYQRELPCLLALLEHVTQKPNCIIVDSFVYLDGISQAGLGFHLYQQLDAKTPVIGVAKSAFRKTPKQTELYRGQSKKPLYITAADLSLIQAKEYIQQMHGEFRLPSLLKHVDHLCRQDL